MECAAIAGITQNPSSYNPIYYPNNNTRRRNDVLYNMYDQGYISKAEYMACKYSKLKLNVGSGATSSTAVVDWYTDLVREDVLDDLIELGYSQKAATALLYQGGLKIYSAVDAKLQDICEKHFIDNAATLVPSLPELQASIFCMDYEGRVLATVGRRGEKTGNRLYSLATAGQRQPGSSIKPLAVYSPSIELGLIDWSTILPDEPIELPNGSKYPTNSYKGYLGDITAQYALEVSANAVSVQIVNGLLSIDKAFQFAKYRYRLGSLYELYTRPDGSTTSDLTLSSMATGGTLIGVTVQDMTEAYAVFGNGGRYYESYSYYYVEDLEGNVILDNRESNFEQVISEGTAGVMNHMLQAVVQNKGKMRNTARGAKIGTWEIFGKTGTTNDFKDRWFMAGTPYCVAGVWCGYEEQGKWISGDHHSVTIWRKVMADYLADKEEIPFEPSDAIVERWYCTKTGGFATSMCPNAALGWYKKDSNMGICSEHTGGYVIRPGTTWTPPPEKPEKPEEPVVSEPAGDTSSEGTPSEPTSSGTTSSSPEQTTSEPPQSTTSG